ncbi:CAP domain-containing protein [Mycolicibacterium smegmatis]|uniref:Conserved secreted protein n=2 Tax=Mycolicibacterium smegmatis (strain ATCC 700084 / mc(2)155) TaxID=246196 RepID=I7G2Y5_MYCS2|nr:CAP domain-containing protein [Mycolicibacterium smegmatis]ABK73113.1 conserved hypothetical protein [Mycolicibacterium smegmatis MC2 155]AFP36829.1 Conserved secreted protein [Mycolicibacterium smegmatis MC2 155]AIU05632.1 hypothetical protein LJ00_01775 [Mycolicibacterium smegmatis MC2 155]AIU12257.1 hypothetical protein LI99_01775 [Mycolicibacterium smegmatis]AIU18881.1 hypothetical protein LI98_01775 [Mycolicibacterium smegmatis]
MNLIAQRSVVLVACGVLTAGAVSHAPDAAADNRRLNSSVVSNVYTVQRQAGCTDNITVDPRLLEAARRHTLDVLNNRSLDGDIGSDGSTPQVRASNADFYGRVAETVAVNPALAINNLDVINQWYHRPDYLAIMRDCGFTRMGVWSENSLDRSVLVAVYGSPEV